MSEVEYVIQAMLFKQHTDTDTAMGSLFKRIAELANEGFSTIVHIGAGNGAELDDYQHISFERLVLVEGDTETAEELQASVQGRDGVEVIEQVVAANAEPVMWHRYNLPALNGLLPPDDLQRVYPRLRVSSRERLPALRLQDLLDRVAVDPARSNLLVLDVPGLQDALLAELADAQLHAFEWIAIGSCGATCNEGGDAADAAIERLQARCYRLEQSLDSDLDWPVSLLRRDEVQRENAQLRAQAADLGAKLQTRDKAEKERNAELERVAAERDAQTALAGEHESRVHGLEQERQGLATKLAESQAALKALTDEKPAQEKRVAELQAQLEALSQARDEQAKLAVDRNSMIQKLTRERDDQGKRAAEQKAQLEKLREEHAQQTKKLTTGAEKSAALAAEHQAQAQRLRQERDAARKQLESEREQQAAVVAEHEQRTEALRQEADKRARVLAQERNDQTTLATGYKSELDKANHSLAEQQKLATDLQTRVEKLAQERDAVISQHNAEVDAARKQASELKKLADNRKTLLDKAAQQSQ
ncbi:MAG: hypothetical protein L0H63_07840, partial [Nitrococcus sp.]|nr:hypothetical protein [Nitrococcus sp.]